MMSGVVRCRSSLVVVAVIAVALLAGCSGGGKKAESAPNTDANGNTPAVLSIGKVTVNSYGPTTKMPASLQKTALAGAQAYVDSAMIAAYNTGKLGAAYATLFDPGLRTAAVQTAGAVLTDVSVGKAKFRAQSTPVSVSGLADNTGAFVYLATRFVISADLTTAQGSITVRRDVEFTFAPAGKQWQVMAYRVRMTRKLPGGATTTTSVASSGSTP